MYNFDIIKIMIDANGNITETNISISDVATVLKATSSDDGTLCTHPNINMFSKYKPTRFSGTKQGVSGLGPLISSTDTEAQKLEKIRAFKALQYRSDNFNCGISVATYPNWTYANRDKDGELNGWVYEKPTGGASSPYRIHDFSLYCHKASPPLTGFYCDSQTVNEKIHITGALNMQSGNTLSLAIGDISTLDDYGICFLVTDKNGKQVPYENEENLSSLDVWFDCKQYALAEGTCKVYPYLKNHRSKLMALLPYAKELTFEYMTRVTELQISWNASGGVGGNENTKFDTGTMSVDYTFYLINNGAGSYDFTNCNLHIIAPANIDEYINNKITAIRGNVTKNLGTISVPQGTTKAITGSVFCASVWNDLESVRNGNVYKECYIVVTIGNYSQATYKLEPYNLTQFDRVATSNDNVGGGGGNGSRE